MRIEPERALELWDNLDDLYGAVALRAERIRQIVLFTLSALLFVLLVVAGIGLAIAKPPLALATAVLLLVSLMYRSVTSGRGLEINS